MHNCEVVVGDRCHKHSDLIDFANLAKWIHFWNKQVFFSSSLSLILWYEGTFFTFSQASFCGLNWNCYVSMSDAGAPHRHIWAADKNTLSHCTHLWADACSVYVTRKTDAQAPVYVMERRGWGHTGSDPQGRRMLILFSVELLNFEWTYSFPCKCSTLSWVKP